MRRTTLLVLLALTGLLQPTRAQWQHPDPRTPRDRNGKPILTAPAPRLAGKPDLSGVWQAARAPADAQRSFLGGVATVAPGLQIDSADVADIHLSLLRNEGRRRTAEARAIDVVTKRRAGSHHRCGGTSGRARRDDGLRIQDCANAKEIICWRARAAAADIWTAAACQDPDPTWMGYSVGRWDGDTLVVQTTGFKEEGWLDNIGHPRGESVLITERFRRRDFGHRSEIRYEDRNITPSFYKQDDAELDSELRHHRVCLHERKDVPHLGKH
jgi:hypothetical protein